MHQIFSTKILQKYDAHYFQCPACKLIQPENPHWLEEAYTSAIASTDVGLVHRNQQNRDRLEPILHLLHPENAPMLDTGGGYGLLCRLLRDNGFNAFTTDEFCQNIFAPTFEPSASETYPTIFAFEVFEHIANGLEFAKSEMAKYQADRLIFSTLTHSTENPPPQDWWYYAFETGQHISLYHDDSISLMAEKAGLHYTRISAELHLFSKEELTAKQARLLQNPKSGAAKRYRKSVKRKRRKLSLRQSDYEAIKASLNS